MTAPAPTVAAPGVPVNRIELATKSFDTLQKSREPYDRQSREAVTSQAAGLGQLGSGQWRSALLNDEARRRLELDAQRDQLINAATEGSVADASTAFQQALAASQLGLASELGRGNLDIGKGSLGLEKERVDLAKEGQAGSLDLEKERLALAKEGQAGSLDLQKAALALDEKVRTGQMTLAERDQALRELQSGEQLKLAQADVTGQIQSGVDEEGNPIYAETLKARQARQQQALQQKALELDEKVRTGQLTLAEKDQLLRELAQSQGNEREGERIQLAKEQLAQQAEQFGASQAQQLELAKLVDATHNRQIDVSTAQGQNTLLLELARIMGGPNGNVPPEFLKSLAKALGVTLPGPTTTGGTGGTGTGGTGTGTGTTTGGRITEEAY